MVRNYHMESMTKVDTGTNGLQGQEAHKLMEEIEILEADIDTTGVRE